MFEYNFNLIKVVDGDTVDIDIDLGFGVWLRNQRIRIMTNKKPIEKEMLVAEKLNGRLAMLGIVAGLGAYLTTGQIIPGFV